MSLRFGWESDLKCLKCCRKLEKKRTLYPSQMDTILYIVFHSETVVEKFGNPSYFWRMKHTAGMIVSCARSYAQKKTVK